MNRIAPPTTPLTEPPRPAGRAIDWSALATPGNTLLVIAGFTLLKAVLLIALSPLDLVADEAHYWDWSRRPMLSYYTKGPGVAWTIAGSTAVFGTSEWAVRLPSVLAAGLTAWVLARIARRISGEDGAGFFTAVIYLALPGFLVTSLLMTIDGPYLLCWALALWAGLHVRESLRHPRPPRGVAAVGSVLPAWIGLGAAVGVGVLYKYTILLLLPGLLIDWLWHTRARSRDDADRFRWTPAQWAGAAAALLTLALCVSPVVVWNHLRGWPTVAHLLGHLHMEGGDIAPAERWHYDPLWTLEFLGTQIGYLGAGLLLLVPALGWGIRRVRERRDRARGPGPATATAPDQPLGPADRGGVFYLLATSLPILMFYLLVSLRTDAEGNWPVAGYLGLIVLAGLAAGYELRRYGSKLETWLAMPEPRPHGGLLRRKPETIFQVGWHWTLGLGLAVPVLVFALPLTAYIPGVARISPVFRLTGHDEAAQRVQRVRETLREQTGSEPILIGPGYGETSLLAFYLPDRPVVFNASTLAGGRTTAYDFFQDTRFLEQNGADREDLLGRPVLFYGGSETLWEALFQTEGLEMADAGGMHQADNGDGPGSDQPERTTSSPWLSAEAARAASPSGRIRPIFTASAYRGLSESARDRASR